jgi:signal transduction histidine kinase/CheY-like chemotaxis protein
VLLIEDVEADAMLLTRELRKHYDATVHRVTSLDALRDAMQQQQWDVVLSDYFMGPFTAAESLKIVRQQDHDVPFIVISGSVGEERAVELMRAGAQDYLLKDSSGRLAAVIDREMQEAVHRRERRRAEHEVANLNKRLEDRVAELETLLQVIPIGILMSTDPEGRAMRHNPAFANMVGISADTDVSLTPNHGDPLPTVLQNGVALPPDQLPMQVAARTGRPVENVELEVVRPDGRSVHMFGSAAPLRDPETGAVRGSVGAFVDLSERRAAEAALRSTEKLATVGRLAATVAHEINNPLEAVTNVLYLVQRIPDLSPSVLQYLDIAQNEMDRIGRIVKQTLGFHRESAVPVDVVVTDLLDEVLDLYSRKLSAKSIHIERRYESRGLVHGFPGELRQVLSNLVVNAIDAVGSGGRVVLHVYDSAERRNSRQSGIRVVVADTGAGIPAEVRARIFDPFFTTKGEKGSGLGLWVSDGIVRKHGGFIRMRSSTQPNCRGTAFSVFLPAKGPVLSELSRSRAS